MRFQRSVFLTTRPFSLWRCVEAAKHWTILCFGKQPPPRLQPVHGSKTLVPVSNLGSYLLKRYEACAAVEVTRGRQGFSKRSAAQSCFLPGSDRRPVVRQRSGAITPAFPGSSK